MAKRSLAGDGLLNGSAHTSLDADESGELLTKSDFFRRQIPPDAINHLIANLTQNTAGTHRRVIALVPWGGAYNRVAADATAFPHRQEHFLVQHLLELTPNASASERQSGRGWLARSWAPFIVGHRVVCIPTSRIQTSTVGNMPTLQKL
jgi:hypothetical protein